LKRFETKRQIFDFLVKFQSETILNSTINQSKNNEIALYNYKNTQFIGEIAIGSIGNTFSVIFDTGSANIWINSNYCDSEGCLSHKKYDGSFYRNYEKSNNTLNVEFGSGELQGFLSKDTVFLANIAVENQTFVEISKEIGEVFAKVKFDGIVGLAFKALSAQNSTPIFDNIMKNGALNFGVFSFYLSKEKRGEYTSQLILGGFNEKLIDGEIRYYDLKEEYYWSIEMESIRINGKDTGLCNKCKAIIDTGTSLITGPSNEILSLLDMINIDDSCENNKNLPEIAFVFQGHEYLISPEDYILYLENTDKNKKQKSCTGLFMPLDVPEPRGPAWILGDLFLMNYVSIFDREKKRLGLAKALKKP